jgi:hypothetical protein
MFRWTAALDAELLLPFAGAPPAIVAAAMLLPGDKRASIAIVERRRVSAATAQPGWHDYPFDAADRGCPANQVIVRSARPRSRV